MPRLILALLLLLWTPSLALAQSPEQIAQEALQLYKAGRYAEAAARFLESFAFSGRATQLNNAAKAYEKADRPRDALDVWERYLRIEGLDQKRRKKAEDRVRALRAQLGAEPAPPPALKAPADRANTTERAA